MKNIDFKYLDNTFFNPSHFKSGGHSAQKLKLQINKNL